MVREELDFLNALKVTAPLIETVNNVDEFFIVDGNRCLVGCNTNDV